MSLPKHHMIERALQPAAPYSHAVEADGWVYITGQIPTLPDNPERPLPEGIEAQTAQVMDNLKIVLDGLGLSLGNVTFARVYLTDFHRDYATMNEIYRNHFDADKLPGRTCVGVTGLAANALVEIDLIAKRP